MVHGGGFFHTAGVTLSDLVKLAVPYPEYAHNLSEEEVRTVICKFYLN